MTELSAESFYNLLPEDDRHFFAKIPSTYLAMNLNEITMVAKPSDLCKRLRVAFWLEHDSAMHNQRKMRLHWVCSGMMTYNAFARSYLSVPARLAWLIQKPLSYEVAMHEALLHGIERVREILDMPLKNAKGEPDPRRAAVILQAFQAIDNRVKGGVVQKVQSMNVNIESKQSIQEVPKSLEEIDLRIAELEGKLDVKQLAESTIKDSLKKERVVSGD